MRLAAAALAIAHAVALAPDAAAQLAKGATAALPAQQVREALFGIDMQGYSPSYRMEWRECIEPEGKTLYETPAGVQYGKAWVTDDGFACFSYEDSNFQDAACFTVSRTGKGLTFHGEYGDLFVTTAIRTGVKSCKPADDLIS